MENMERGSVAVANTKPHHEFAASSWKSLSGGCSLVCPRKEDVQGASLNGCEPNFLLV